MPDAARTELIPTRTPSVRSCFGERSRSNGTGSDLHIARLVFVWTRIAPDRSWNEPEFLTIGIESDLKIDCSEPVRRRIVFVCNCCGVRSCVFYSAVSVDRSWIAGIQRIFERRKARLVNGPGFGDDSRLCRKNKGTSPLLNKGDISADFQVISIRFKIKEPAQFFREV